LFRKYFVVFRNVYLVKNIFSDWLNQFRDPYFLTKSQVDSFIFI